MSVATLIAGVIAAVAAIVGAVLTYRASRPSPARFVVEASRRPNSNSVQVCRAVNRGDRPAFDVRVTGSGLREQTEENSRVDPEGWVEVVVTTASQGPQGVVTVEWSDKPGGPTRSTKQPVG
jgi:hypothetical protein